MNAQLARRSCVIAPTIVGDDDPSIYDYDGAYESFKAPDKVSHQLSQADTKSREPPVRVLIVFAFAANLKMFKQIFFFLSEIPVCQKSSFDS